MRTRTHYSNLPQHLPRADNLLSEGNLKTQDICGNRGFDQSHLSSK